MKQGFAFRSGHAGQSWRGWPAFALVTAILASGAGPGSAQAETDHPFRVAFSSAIFGDVSRADAGAAVVAWQATILDRAGVPFNSHPMFCDDVPALIAALKAGEVDAVTLQFPEYAEVPSGLLESEFIYINARRGGIYERYVLLVPAKSGVTGIAQLRGKTLVHWSHARACLSPHWLDMLLAGEGEGLAGAFFGRQTAEAKAAKVILPVFFGQADACVITKSAFSDMCELNPQVGQRVRILAESPDLVPSFLCFRKGYMSPYRPRVEAAIRTLHDNTTGKQVLTVFGCDRIAPEAGTCLKSAWDLVESHSRLVAKASSPRKIRASIGTRGSRQP